MGRGSLRGRTSWMRGLRRRLLMRRCAGVLRLTGRRLAMRRLLRPSVRADFALRLCHHERGSMRLRSRACYMHRRHSGRRK